MKLRLQPSQAVGLATLLLILAMSTGCVATGFLDYVGKKDQDAETVYDTLNVEELATLGEGFKLMLVLQDSTHLQGIFRGMNPAPAVGLQVPNENPALFNSDPLIWVPQEKIVTVVHIDTGRNLRTRAVLVGFVLDTLFWVGVSILLSGFAAIGYMA